MTLREAMRQSAQMTMESKQRDRSMPAGATPAGRGPEHEESECHSAGDDYIFPRFSFTTGVDDSTANIAVDAPSPAVTGPPAHPSAPDETVQPKLPYLHRDVKCDCCGWTGVRYRCSRCKVARYCTASCQRKHWSAGHKDVCPLLCQAALAAADGSKCVAP